MEKDFWGEGKGIPISQSHDKCKHCLMHLLLNYIRASQGVCFPARFVTDEKKKKTIKSD